MTTNSLLIYDRKEAIKTINFRWYSNYNYTMVEIFYLLHLDLMVLSILDP
jgi:hypothetical protein